jgi:putative tricarboxylic transport membrane protein
MLGSGVLGYGLRKCDFEVAPVILGLILSPMVEMALRQSLGMSNGSYAIFVMRPISLAMLSIALALIAASLVPALFRGADLRRRLALTEGGKEV